MKSLSDGHQDSKEGHVSTLEGWPWEEVMDGEMRDLSFSPGSASQSAV